MAGSKRNFSMLFRRERLWAAAFVATITACYDRNMTQISIQEIQLDPLGFVRRIEVGEPLQIVRGNVAIAEIQPVPQRAKPPQGCAFHSRGFIIPATGGRGFRGRTK